MKLLFLFVGIVCALGLFIEWSACYGQTPGWTTFTSNESRPCRASISHPANWSVQEKQGRFDPLADEFRISGPSGVPFLGFTMCKKMTNASSTPLTLVEMADMGKNLVLNEGRIRQPSSEVRVIQGSRVEPGLVGGQDAGVFTLILNPFDKSLPSVEAEGYVLMHGDTLYMIGYFDRASTFDSPFNKQIREQMLHSIKFLD